MPPASIAPQKGTSRNPIFRVLFGFERNGHWNNFSSSNKSDVKAVRATVGISGKARSLETITWPAAWKEVSAMARSCSQPVGLFSSGMHLY